jgi:hypothetical protein
MAFDLNQYANLFAETLCRFYFILCMTDMQKFFVLWGDVWSLIIVNMQNVLSGPFVLIYLAMWV